MCVASVGDDLRVERERMVKAVLDMGHLPIDLVATGLFEDGSKDTVDRHIGRTDYLILLVGDGDGVSDEAFAAVERTYESAGNHGVPVLALLVEQATPSKESMSVMGSVKTSGVESLTQQLKTNSKAIVETLDNVGASAAWVLIKLIETHRRPGWVSSTTLPSGDVASELARLSSENADLRAKLGSVQTDDEDKTEERLQAAGIALNENKIVIPMWDRSTNRWEKPVETTLYEFFIRLAPEMVVEKSLNEASQFVPTGVCELDPGDFTTRWVVPPNNINLWFTDLMALGLVQPSSSRHHPKDTNQYWTLTPDGRDMLSRVRRSVLETGGHRHVGFTSEYRVPDSLRP